MSRLILIFAFYILVFNSLYSQQVSLKAYDKPMKTYGFSDPSPVMPLGRFYPYHRFDGFSMEGKMQAWKAIDMQNEQISLRILPEVGGKIWGAHHLKTGFPFIYHNDVVKFRDVAARGPWTSGGVELNFGDYGHAPTCATPVDYVTRENPDGSKSCFLSSFDWSSRTHWTVEVKLQKETSYFTTSSTWSNMTPFAASNYQWMNAGFNASDDLEFLYPGNAYIDHDGKPFSWPVNEAGRKINFYKENNFGTYKSYHVLGETTDYFGGYWQKPDVGFIHYSPYYQKMGKKLWIWGLSRQGMIWENLLTDNNGQYVELQSGRFYNQAGPASIESPFKYNVLMPLQSDSWEEKWMCFSGTKGHTKATEHVVLHTFADSVRFYFHEPVSGSLRMVDQKGVSEQKEISVNAGTVLTVHWPHASLEKVLLNGEVLLDKNSPEVVKRPLKTPEPMDWDTESGQMLRAKSLLAQRNIPESVVALQALLEQNSQHVEALVTLASIYIRQNKPEAENHLRKALEINTYDGWANFYWGYFHFVNNDFTNAEDGFSVAVTQHETKHIALNYLAVCAFRVGDHARALKLANESMAYFPKNQESRYVKMLALRGTKEHKVVLDGILSDNPLDPMALTELYLIYNDNLLKTRWVNEMPHQNYIETALWYAKMGLLQDAVKLLEASPDDIMASLWLAHFKFRTGKDVSDIMKMASLKSHQLAFPFRTEEYALLAWANQYFPDWKWHYMLGKLQWSHGQLGSAKISFSRAGQPNEAAFYLNKALLWKENTDSVRVALSSAYKLDTHDWRTVKAWTEFLLNEGKEKEALVVISEFQTGHPEQFLTGQVLARVMFANRQYKKVVDYLTSFKSLPNEGASGLHQLFREACLFAALENATINGKRSLTNSYLALADTYPENLGSGQPYDHDYSLTKYISSLLTGKDDVSAWKTEADANDFPSYLKLTSTTKKEAFIAKSFFTTLSKVKKG